MTFLRRFSCFGKTVESYDSSTPGHLKSGKINAPPDIIDAARKTNADDLDAAVQNQKAKDILEGRKIDSTFYPVTYGADEDDDWTDPEVWKKENPSLGVTVGIDKVEAACESAKQNPGEENTFRQLRLNQWVKQAVHWMPMDK